jgi:hypothetical protein
MVKSIQQFNFSIFQDFYKEKSNLLPGMRVVWQTPHQGRVMAQNSFLLWILRDNAVKEATTAWVEASEAEKKGSHTSWKKISFIG